MEGVEKTDAVMVCPQQRVGFAPKKPYTMNVDRRKRRNCYSCRGFEHLARNCRNRRTENRIGEGRRLEYGSNNEQSNLKEEGDLIVFN